MPARRLELVAEQGDELAAALADGARAQYADGDLLASRQSFERAYRLAEQAGDVQAMAVAALGLAGLWVCERRTVTSAVLLEARLQHVLSLLDGRSALALRVRTRLAGEADYFHGTHAAILAALAEVRAAAELAGAAGAAGPGAPGGGAEHRPPLPARPGPRPAAPGTGRRADQGELPHRAPRRPADGPALADGRCLLRGRSARRAAAGRTEKTTCGSAATWRSASWSAPST